MDAPYLSVAVLTAVAATSGLLVKALPVVASEGAAPAGRYAALDGLRGLLAASVLVYHARIARGYFDTGEWVEPASAYYRFAGAGAVAVFFMITGLLFWGKAIDGRLRFVDTMRSRLRRIMPLYLFGFVLIFGIVWIETDFRLRVPAGSFVASVIRWLTGGLLGNPPINGLSTIPVNAGVTWTLRYEWLFYFALVPLGRLARPGRFLVLAATCLGFVAAMQLGSAPGVRHLLVALPFLVGMATAYLVREEPSVRPVASPLRSGAVVVSAVLTGWLFGPEFKPWTPWAALLLMPAFVAIARGETVFGWLDQSWMRWLGHVSYSVYLLHGIVLMTFLSVLNARWPIREWSEAAYVGACSASAVLVVLAATLTYRFIERPFFRRVSGALPNALRAGRTS